MAGQPGTQPGWRLQVSHAGHAPGQPCLSVAGSSCSSMSRQAWKTGVQARESSSGSSQPQATCRVLGGGGARAAAIAASSSDILSVMALVRAQEKNWWRAWHHVAAGQAACKTVRERARAVRLCEMCNCVRWASAQACACTVCMRTDAQACNSQARASAARAGCQPSHTKQPAQTHQPPAASALPAALAHLPRPAVQSPGAIAAPCKRAAKRCQARHHAWHACLLRTRHKAARSLTRSRRQGGRSWQQQPPWRRATRTRG